MSIKYGYQTIYLKTYEDWDDFKKNLDGNFLFIKTSILRKLVKLIFLFFCSRLLFIKEFYLAIRLWWSNFFGC